MLTQIDLIYHFYSPFYQKELQDFNFCLSLRVRDKQRND